MEEASKPDLIDDPETLVNRVTSLERQVARLQAQVELLIEQGNRVQPLDIA